MKTANPRAFALVCLALAACAPAAGAPRAEDDAAAPTGPKRISAAILNRDPVTLRSSAVRFGGDQAGVDVIEDLVHTGPTRRDDSNVLQPLLAEAVPSIDNGHWKVLADGRMETSWTLKPGALWHDGTPLTSQDLLFTLNMCMDQEAVGFCDPIVGFSYIQGARALDDRTVTVEWKQPYIDADALFTTQFGIPVPRHLLEDNYRDNKKGLADLPYWTREFVGAGPFRLREWVEGSHMTLAAFDRYVLGRPKISEIVVRFIPDPNALVANMLSGDIDVNLGRGMSLEQAVQIRDQWPTGRLEVGTVNWLVAYPQFIDPHPEVLLDVRFRKGLAYAMNRQEMADTLQASFAPVAHAYFDTSQPQYRELDPLVVKYEFDPRKAIELIESTSLVRGADGSFRDPTGQRLSVEIRVTGTQELATKAQLATADYWQRVGVAVDAATIGPQRVNDREYRATRPAFEMGQVPDGMKGLRRAHSSETALPENNFSKVNNVSRYMSRELDGLLDRFFSTIPMRERLQLLGQILNHTTDQVTLIPIFYGTQPTMVSNRLLNVGPRRAAEGTNAWNAHLWDVA